MKMLYYEILVLFLSCCAVDIAVMSGDICCSVVCGTLVGVSVFSIKWSELLILIQ